MIPVPVHSSALRATDLAIGITCELLQQALDAPVREDRFVVSAGCYGYLVPVDMRGRVRASQSLAPFFKDETWMSQADALAVAADWDRHPSKAVAKIETLADARARVIIAIGDCLANLTLQRRQLMRGESLDDILAYDPARLQAAAA